MYKNFLKRFLDILFALIALPFILLLTIIIGPIIWLEDKGPIFYLGKRRGRYGKVFRMFKFRSMKVNAPDIRNLDNSTMNSSHDPRVTRIGGFLRKTSIDELPQIFNILIGDMSWIGPRASVPIEGVNIKDMNQLQQKRLRVRPGITGYSASLYRNSIPKEKKRELDCYYVDNLSFALDMKIIYWTARTVLLRKNLYTN